MARIFALLILVATITGAAAGERFPILQPDQMNADQKKLLQALLAGPRGGGNPVLRRYKRYCAADPSMRGCAAPISATDCRTWQIHSLQNLAAAAPQPVRDPDHRARMDHAIRMDAHYPLAMKAGLDAKVATSLRSASGHPP